MANRQRWKTIAAIGILGVMLLLGAVGYTVLKAPAEASAPIQAIPLAASTTEPSVNDTASAQPQTPATAATSDATPSVELVSETSTPAATSAATTGAATGETATAQSSPIIAQIVPEESEARFVIDEVLNNAPKTVVGTTNQVAGELAVDPSDPAESRVGTIQINARTLTTDSEFRNRAIKNRILLTDQYEFITFTPTRIVGLEQAAAGAETYSFQVVGDLLIRDTSREVTFDVTARPVSETRLEGTAQTTIRYADFGITIPRAPAVASVSDEVRLELDFVAVPK